jgi:flagellar biosynthesis/type III secretory pathway M-ring protein FliF/YscJ
MNRLNILSRANSLKVIAISAWSWVVGYALPTLAQKQPQGQVVAAEIKGMPTHENSSFLEAVFTGINYITAIALAGVLIFGLIWLLQRRNVVDDTEGDEATTAESGTTSSDATTDSTGTPSAEATKEATAGDDAKAASSEEVKEDDKAKAEDKPAE